MIENDDNDINFDDEIAYIPVPKLKPEKIIINYKQPIMEIKKMTEVKLNDYGVENVKKVSVALTSLINAGITSYSDDGKITFGDIGHFIKIIPDMLSAIPAISYVKQELTDKITDAELNELKNAILGTIEIKNELDKEFFSQIFDTLHLISKLVTNRIERNKKSATE